jgi:hypothetical protein
MGTKNNPGKFACYEKAEPDEPMFVLLGRDKHAAALVWLWAALREHDGEDKDKVQEACECCLAMGEWALSHKREVVSVGEVARVLLSRTVLAGMKEVEQSSDAAGGGRGAGLDPEAEQRKPS